MLLLNGTHLRKEVPNTNGMMLPGQTIQRAQGPWKGRFLTNEEVVRGGGEAPCSCFVDRDPEQQLSIISVCTNKILTVLNRFTKRWLLAEGWRETEASLIRDMTSSYPNDAR